MKSTLSLLSLLAIGCWLPGCSQRNQETVASAATVRAQLVHSESSQVPQLLRVIGTVHAKDSAVISAQVTGRITDVFVREGDFVRAGQLLLALDDAGLHAGVEQAHATVVAAQNQQMAAQADASLAASTLARYQILRQQKSVSPQEFDEVEKRSEAAQERLAALKAQSEAAQASEKSALASQGYARLHSPFAGIVTQRLVDPGTLASPGVPLLQIDKGGPLQLYTTVDQSVIAAVAPGKAMTVEIAGLTPSQIAGTVAQIVPAADPASHSFLVKLDLPATSRLKAGMFGTALLPSGTRIAISIPSSALAMRGSLACVYVLDSQGTAQLRYVSVGAAHGNSVEVLSGLSGGETLIDSPGDRDFAGRKIEANP